MFCLECTCMNDALFPSRATGGTEKKCIAFVILLSEHNSLVVVGALVVGFACI